MSTDPTQAADATAVSPVASIPSTPTKRRISPSAERSLPKKVLVFTTPSKTSPKNPQRVDPVQPFAPRQLLPRDNPDFIHQYTHSHPSRSAQDDEEKAIWHNRHVLLSSNLKDYEGISISSDDIHPLLYSIFPGITNVTDARYRSHLLFQVKQLPSGPWPVTVGGLPYTILDESSRGRALMFPRQNLGNFAISICQDAYTVDQLLSDDALRKLAAEVTFAFQKNLPNTRIIEIMFTCERTFYIVLDDHIKISAIRNKLPGKIANCPVGYLNDSELHRSLWVDLPSKLHISPQPMKGIFDDTVYETLRPGVIISSKMLKEHSHPAIFSTTSGVLVKNPAGDPFMTAASHGIGEWETVWQANDSNHPIGMAAVEIPFTDVSLVRLNRNVKFTNETFENSAGVSPHFSRLLTSTDALQWPLCYLNSPYTGSVEGNIVMKSVKLEQSTCPTQDNLRYIVYQWPYMGQEEDNDDKVRPPDGTCGSVIWDDDGVILGFYHYYITEGKWAGFAASVSASEVVEAGYTL